MGNVLNEIRHFLIYRRKIMRIYVWGELGYAEICYRTAGCHQDGSHHKNLCRQAASNSLYQLYIPPL